MQKYRFKTAPGRRFLGITPEVLSDGEHTLLANGFWGASRHINYLGEIIQAVAIALASGYFGIPSPSCSPARPTTTRFAGRSTGICGIGTPRRLGGGSFRGCIERGADGEVARQITP